MWIIASDLLFRAISIVMIIATFTGPGMKKWLPVLTSAFAGYGLTILVLHKVLVGRFNFLYYVQDVLKKGLAYQDLDFLVISVLGCTGAALASGWLCERLLRIGHVRSTFCRNMILCCTAALGLGAISCLYVGFTGTEYLRINEISTGALTPFTIDDVTFTDYVEIYNGGVLPNSLYEFYLSDKETDLKRLRIPDKKIPAGGCLLIPLGEETFSLRSEGGETVVLSDRTGKILDKVVTVKAEKGFAYGRQPDGADSWYSVGYTPGTENRNAARRLQKPVFSEPSGFYKDAFYLTLQSEDEATVHYTLDCSTPTADSPIFTGPIYVYDRSPEENLYRNIPQLVTDWLEKNYDQTPVDKAFVVRALAIDENGNESAVATATYFIDKDAYRDHMVVSLVSDPEGLFGENGICVAGPEYEAWYLGSQEGRAPKGNFQQQGSEWERLASMEWMSEEASGQQLVGIRIQGASARYNTPQKRFSIYARSEYSGSSLLDLELVPGIRTHSVMTRASIGNTLGMMFGRELDLAIEEPLQISLFLDGELWIESSMLEKYDSRYFEQYYGIPEDNLVVVKGPEVSEGEPEDLELRNDVNTFLEEHDMSVPENYDAFCGMVDMQSYMDFMSVNIYLDNLDFNERKNIIWWRSRDVVPGSPYEDGRWRFGLYDMDYLDWHDARWFEVNSTWEKNTFSLAGRTNGGPIDQQLLFSSLRQNPEFCREFVLTFMNVANIRFSQENCRSYFEEYHFPISDYYKNFFENRRESIAGYLGEEFALSGTLETLEVSISDSQGGSVRIGELEVPFSEDGTWSGLYYTDYAVNLTAIPNPGYSFVGWTGVDGNGNHASVQLEEGGARICAIFEKNS